MLKTETIERSLSHHYSKKNLKEGYLLYAQGNVEEFDQPLIAYLQRALEIGFEPEFVAFVQDDEQEESLEIFLYYDAEDNIWYGDCDCEEDYCRHEVAVLHAFNDFIAKINIQNKPEPSKRGRKRGRPEAIVKPLMAVVAGEGAKSNPATKGLSGEYAFGYNKQSPQTLYYT
jgi:hypothetical protein